MGYLLLPFESEHCFKDRDVLLKFCLISCLQFLLPLPPCIKLQNGIQVQAPSKQQQHETRTHRSGLVPLPTLLRS